MGGREERGGSVQAAPPEKGQERVGEGEGVGVWENGREGREREMLGGGEWEVKEDG